jgi:hypoxanthine phosphoribosyltransferase
VSGKVSSYSAQRIRGRVTALGRQIAKDYRGRKIDVVVTMDRGFVFAADLLREVNAPVVCHFVREQVRQVRHGKSERSEVFFGKEPSLAGCDVLLVDAVMDSGVTQEFLLRRLGESKPRSLRVAVLLDKANGRRVALEPDYFGFRTASNPLWVGYGLADSTGKGRNGRGLTPAGRAASKKKGASKSA